ncbi:MAG TPA: hypothetical protein VGX03_33050 [Candidatus Binatia bacterium]|nr:hypothetical protein [Candidatus Binatia bacterium]
MKTDLSDDVRKTMTQVLAAGGFATPEDAAWEVSLTVALAKVSHYERECLGFRHKYGRPLESLREHVERMVGTEDFAMEDDLADWEFAEQALALWQERVEVLRRAAA